MFEALKTEVDLYLSETKQKPSKDLIFNYLKSLNLDEKSVIDILYWMRMDSFWECLYEYKDIKEIENLIDFSLDWCSARICGKYKMDFLDWDDTKN